MAVVYNKEVVGSLDVIPTFIAIMQESTGKDSVYIRAKETMQNFLDSANMSDVEKASQLQQTLVSITANLTDAALNASIQIAKEDREAPYKLAEQRESTLLKQQQRENLAKEYDNMVLQGDAMEIDTQLKVVKGWAEQAAMEKDYGIDLSNLPTTSTVKLPETAIRDRGTRWEQMQQTKMSVYATLAKSYRENGVVSWTVDDETNKINTITDLAPNTPGLTKRQEDVAIRQKQSFNDNMAQHAANSSANMIGLLLSAADAGAITDNDVDRWRRALDYLLSGTTN